MPEPMTAQPPDAYFRLLRCFTGRWTDWFPIGVFLIRHRDGPILVDAGSSPRCIEGGYFSTLGYFVSVLNQLDVSENDDLISQLAKIGVHPTALQAVILTHLHYDHSGALKDIVEAAPDVPIYISRDHWEAFGKSPRYAAFQGCAPNHWPEDFTPKLLEFGDHAIGPWLKSAPITKDGRVRATPTPGHVSGHISVIALDSNPSHAELTYLLTGDATYSSKLVEKGGPDGVNSDPMTAFESLQLIKEFARGRDVIVLPSHDPESPCILKEKRIYKPRSS